MKKWLLALVLLLSVGCGHPYKHTGPCVLSFKLMSSRYWFVRPNGETFEMWFDNPPPFGIGFNFEDITYQDDNKDMRHFVRATFHK